MCVFKLFRLLENFACCDCGCDLDFLVDPLTCPFLGALLGRWIDGWMEGEMEGWRSHFRYTMFETTSVIDRPQLFYFYPKLSIYCMT